MPLAIAIDQKVKYVNGTGQEETVFTIASRPGEEFLRLRFAGSDRPHFYPITQRNVGANANAVDVDINQPIDAGLATQDDGPVLITPLPGQSSTQEVGYVSDRRKRERAINLVRQALSRLAGRGNLELKIDVNRDGRLTLKSATIPHGSRWRNEDGSETIPTAEISRLLNTITFPEDLRGNAANPVITFTVSITKIVQ